LPPTNSLNGVLLNSTLNITAGTVEVRSPAANVTNLPGVRTWNVLPGTTLRIGSGLLETSTLLVAENAQLTMPAGGAAKTLRVTTLSGNGQVDLADHKMIVDHTGASPIGTWNGTAYTGLTRKILDGRAGGNWTGNGIITSMTDADAPSFRTTVGITEAALALNLDLGETGMWKGQLVDDTTVLIAYTYIGDADLSGAIDGDDFFLIDAGYQAGSYGFGRGDFNYDGRIDADDYFLIDTDYSTQWAAPLGAAAVPEPGVSGLVAAAAILRRRRK
jgi:hypothetical protein